MNRVKLWMIGGGLLTAAAWAIASGAPTGAQPNETPEVSALRQQFHAELTGLRVELIEQGLNFQHWKIAQLERELQRVEADTRRLDEAEQGIMHQLAQVEQQIEPSASGEAQPFGEQAGMKAELSGPRLKGVQNRRQPLLEQATELRGQLQQEEQRERELRQQLKQVKAASADTPRSLPLFPFLVFPFLASFRPPFPLRLVNAIFTHLSPGAHTNSGNKGEPL